MRKCCTIINKIKMLITEISCLCFLKNNIDTKYTTFARTKAHKTSIANNSPSAMNTPLNNKFTPC